MVSYHFYLAPTQSPPVAIFTQCSHLITPVSLSSLYILPANFFFPKSSEVPRSAAARALQFTNRSLPLAGVKTSITTHLPNGTIEKSHFLATRSQTRKHLRVCDTLGGKKPCAEMGLRRLRN